MPEVYIDGELEDFTQSSPATVGEMRSVLEQMVAERGRVLAGLTMGGIAFPDSDDARVLDPDSRIDAATLSAQEALAQLAQVARNAGVEARAVTADLIVAVLRQPWSEAQPRCVHLTGILSRLLDSAITVAAHQGETSATTGAVQQLSTALEAWVSAVQAGDAATVCLRTEDQLDPAITQVEAALAAFSP